MQNGPKPNGPTGTTGAEAKDLQILIDAVAETQTAVQTFVKTLTKNLRWINQILSKDSAGLPFSEISAQIKQKVEALEKKYFTIEYGRWEAKLSLFTAENCMQIKAEMDEIHTTMLNHVPKIQENNQAINNAQQALASLKFAAAVKPVVEPSYTMTDPVTCLFTPRTTSRKTAAAPTSTSTSTSTSSSADNSASAAEYPSFLRTASRFLA